MIVRVLLHRNPASPIRIRRDDRPRRLWDRRWTEALLVSRARARGLIFRCRGIGTIVVSLSTRRPRIALRQHQRAAILADALQEIGLIEHGPRRLGRSGAPIASAAPSAWGSALDYALREAGYEVRRS